ncbi:MAG: hypothetical protein KJ697_02095 [Nanoarchaeota archaeon]|nr:hypothetical protein [Nanoarchaeota archaeon]MBU4124667.1 hypothetical protein [Nanoarchaeota archaeon]
MKIKTNEFIPDIFRNRKFSIEELGDKIKVSSKIFGKSGSNPKSIILPKQIELNGSFAEAIGLYIGDGKLTERDLRHSSFGNKDEDIIKFMLEFFVKTMNIPLDKMTLTITYRIGDGSVSKKKWSNILGVCSEKFKLKQSNRIKNDMLTIQINSTIFRIFLKNMIACLLIKFKENVILRRGFLRGYFAAEGTIGFNKKENFLNYIGFAYNPLKEHSLRNYCIECLNLENIESKYKERTGNRAEIIITKWSNYSKLWKVGLFDRCDRKKNIFDEILYTRKVYCKLNNKFRKRFFGCISLTQRNIADLTNSWQGNICRVLSGNNLITINQLKTLSNYSNYSEESILENIKSVRIGTTKIFIYDREFIEYLFKGN